MDLIKIARMLSVVTAREEIVSMPVIKSNVPLDKIPGYIEMFSKCDIPINLHISEVNAIPPRTAISYSIDSVESVFKSIADESHRRNDSTDFKEAIEEDFKRFLEEIDPNAINIIKNSSSTDIYALRSPEWLAHDLYHVIEYGFDLNDILEAVREDLDNPNAINSGFDASEIFVYWLPDDMKEKAPALKFNTARWQVFSDSFADLMVNYLNDPVSPRNVKINYKPFWISNNGDLRTTPTDPYSVNNSKVNPAEDAHAVQTLVDLLFESIYKSIRSKMNSLIGKVILIG